MSLNCDVYFWRQCLILLSLLLESFSGGITLAYPSILNPAILSPNSTDIRATPDQASWIASVNGISGLLSYVVQSSIMQIFGRKTVHIYINVILTISWIVFAAANSIPALFAARIIQGLAIAGIYVNNIIVAEYVHPERRGYFITLKKVTMAMGILFCHSMVLLLSWRHVAAIGAAAPALAIVIACFWPESPAFLASRGRFEECKKSFEWLQGEKQNPELDLLISTQTDRFEKKKLLPKRNLIKKVLKKLLKRDFRKSFLIIILLVIAIDVSGRYFFTAYVTQIMIKIMGDKKVAVYCSIVSDSFSVIAMAASCILIKYYKRRVLLLSLGTLASALMLLVSLTMFLRSKMDLGPSYAWLSISILILQNFVVYLGVIPLSFALIGEVIPLEHRGVSSFSCGMVFTIFYFLTIKLTPMMVKRLGVEGTYLIYGLFLLATLVGLYFVLPETKDKTLQEIEDEINGVKRSLLDNKPILKKKDIAPDINLSKA